MNQLLKEFPGHIWGQLLPFLPFASVKRVSLGHSRCAPYASVDPPIPRYRPRTPRESQLGSPSSPQKDLLQPVYCARVHFSYFRLETIARLSLLRLRDRQLLEKDAKM